MNSGLRSTKRLLHVQVRVGTGQELYGVSLSWRRCLLFVLTLKGYSILWLFYSLLRIIRLFFNTRVGLKTYGIRWAVVICIKVNLLRSRICLFNNWSFLSLILRWRRFFSQRTFFIFLLLIFLAFLGLSQIILDLIVVAATTFIAHLKINEFLTIK